jgi:hypothetical protein
LKEMMKARGILSSPELLSSLMVVTPYWFLSYVCRFRRKRLEDLLTVTRRWHGMQRNDEWLACSWGLLKSKVLFWWKSAWYLIIIDVTKTHLATCGNFTKGILNDYKMIRASSSAAYNAQLQMRLWWSMMGSPFVVMDDVTANHASIGELHCN